MKLYTEEQVRQMLSIYMAEVFLNEDGKMPTIDDILSYKTPIELLSDEQIEEYNDGSTKLNPRTYYDAFQDGAKWMKKQIIKQNK
jgi:hypothetical protein